MKCIICGSDEAYSYGSKFINNELKYYCVCEECFNKKNREDLIKKKLKDENSNLL